MIITDTVAESADAGQRPGTVESASSMPLARGVGQYRVGANPTCVHSLMHREAGVMPCRGTGWEPIPDTAGAAKATLVSPVVDKMAVSLCISKRLVRNVGMHQCHKEGGGPARTPARVYESRWLVPNYSFRHRRAMR